MTLDIGYRKAYSIRRSVPNKKSFEVTFPYEVLEREARKRDMTVEEFVSKFTVVAEYDSFEGVRYTFQPAKDGNKKTE